MSAHWGSSDITATVENADHCRCGTLLTQHEATYYYGVCAACWNNACWDADLGEACPRCGSPEHDVCFLGSLPHDQENTDG